MNRQPIAQDDRMSLEAGSSSPQSPHAAPVGEKERINVVDVLRGFAIFGILLVNMYSFAGMQLEPANYSGLNKIVVISILFFAQAKFYSLFSFLFGWGMWIQMSRAMSRGVRFVPLYVRRMLILLVIGIAHGILIWTGDILTTYALFGLLLLLFRKSSERTLLIAIALFLILPMILNLPGQTMNGFREWYAQATEPLRTFGPQDNGIYGTGSYMEITERRLQDFVGGQTWFIYWIGNVFAMFLLGFFAGKKRYFEEIEENISLFRRTAGIGLVVGILFAGFAVLATVKPEIVDPEWHRWIRIATRTIGAPALMLFYVSAITLLYLRENWRARLAPLGPVGRMALTNYLSQSVVLTLIFYGYGLTMYGEIGPAIGLILTFLVYLAQIRFSAWWLDRYKAGPMEWWWRTLTYGRLQKIRRRGSQSEPFFAPATSRIKRAISGVPALVFLLLVWTGLILWAVALLRWNARLNSELFENPFTEPAAVAGLGQQAESETDAAEEAISDDQEPATEAYFPEIQPVDYQPGSVVSSGDLRALAGTFDYARAFEHVTALSSGEFEGRQAGSIGGVAASEYIARMMADYGLQPGGYGGTYYQPFPLTYTLLLETPELKINGDSSRGSDRYQLYEDFAPFISGYAGGGEVTGQVFWLNQCRPEDFQGQDLVGKVALCQASGSGSDNNLISRRAMEYGASGLLLTADPERRPADFGYRHTESWVPRSIPVLFVYDQVISELFQGSAVPLEEIDDDTSPFLLESTAQFRVATSDATTVEARNVLGILPGRDPNFSDEVVVIGAHFDHMGSGPDGTYWPGAIDNASGVAAVLEIARSWREQGYVPRRTVLFAAWDAEEWGLVGSTEYVTNPAYPLDETVASIQMDMIGGGPDSLSISGSPWLGRQLLDSAESLEVQAEISEIGRSDHIPFLQAGVPANLLIWAYEGALAPQYHRPSDLPEAIEPEKMITASQVAEVTLLDLVESEPAIRNLLAQRSQAALANDQAAFLNSSRPDQRTNDAAWLSDLHSFQPSSVNLTVNNLEIDGASAVAEVRTWVQYPDPENSENNLILSSDLPVHFTRQGTEWSWAGPALSWASAPEGEAAITVAYPREIEGDFQNVGIEGVSLYSEFANLLGLSGETDSSILLMPDSEALRVSTALSLPADQRTWIGPGTVKLLYRENISQTTDFKSSIAQLLLANNGVTEDAAPWLWNGLPAALDIQGDMVGTHNRLIPVLHSRFVDGMEQDGEAGSWAAVEYVVEQVGWRGLGRLVSELGRACDQDLCQDISGQDAALQRVLRMNSDAFRTAWQSSWKARLDSIQNELDATVQSRAQAVLDGDEESFLNSVDQSSLNLVAAEQNWFANLFRNPPEAFSLTAYPTALLENGDVLANVTFEFQLAGGGPETIELPVLFENVGDGLVWAGTAMNSLEGDRITLRYPGTDDQLAMDLLEDAEAMYSQLSQLLGIEEPQELIIELLADQDEFRTTVALTFPAVNWIQGYSRDGTAVWLRMLPVGQAADYSGELAVQLARQLLYQQGVRSEWLLKGISTYLSQPLDRGATTRATSAALPELFDSMSSGLPYDFGDIPDDGSVREELFELARVQSWDSIRYLVERYGWDALTNLVRLDAAAVGLDEAAKEALGISLAEFTEEWRSSFLQGHQPDGAVEIASAFDSQAAFEHIDYLTGDELAGRLAGTGGGSEAAAYIAALFKEYGLYPAGDATGSSYFQNINITSTTWIQEPYFEILGYEPFALRQEMLFSRATVTGTGVVSGELVWVGANPEQDTELTGQIMVAIASEAVDRQVEQALALGAEGLILLGIKDEIQEIYAKTPLSDASVAGLPVLELTKDGTLRLLEIWDHTYMELSTLDSVLPMELEAHMGAKFELPNATPAANVLAVFPGSDPFLSQEFIIVGAHYDHVGDDPAGQECAAGQAGGNPVCVSVPGERYSGANDNASGISALLELIRLWHEEGYAPKRSIVFAAWDAQEFGQLGSQHYVLYPTVPLSRTLAMIQMDGIGGGEGFFPGIQGEPARDSLLLHSAAMAASALDEEMIVTGYLSESDHWTFSSEGIPALLVSWRLADENNLPDAHADGVSPERLAQSGSIAALTIMMLAQ